MNREIQSPPARQAAAGLAGVSCLFLLGGCLPENPAAKAATTEKVFQVPSPRDAGDQPPVAESKSKGDAIAASLAAIHHQLSDMQLAYRHRAMIEGDLKEVADRMRPLIEEARAHCDAMVRAAEDLRARLPETQAGYVVAGASYRRQAEGYRDANLKAITRKLADQFDWMASETPKRLALVDNFLKELRDAQDFLAETDRCVRDTSAALAVFSAHAKVPEMSVDARAFSRRLGEFISVALDYEAKLLNTPAGPPANGGEAERSPAPPAPMRQDPPPTASGPSTRRASSPAAPAVPPATQGEAHVVWTSKLRLRPKAPATVAPAPKDPLPAGAQLSGEVTSHPIPIGIPVSLNVQERKGDSFTGVVSYNGDLAQGRRGVRGRVSPDGRMLTFWAEWYEGTLSPEEIRYELKSIAGGFEGTWSTQSLRGTIRLFPPTP